MKGSIFVCLFCASAVWTASGDNNFDGLVDEVLEELEQKMINESKTLVSLPDLDLPITKKFLLWDFQGFVETSGGSVGNLSTIKRIGDIVPIETEDIIISATFGMTDLTIHFDEIKFSFLGIHLDDGVDVKVADNAANFNVTFHYDSSGNCSVRLNSAQVTSLSGFHTTLLPTGILHDIEDGLITATMDLASPFIKNAINQRLQSVLNQVIQKLDLCSFLPF